MDIIASPTTVTFNTQFGAPPSGGSPIEVVEGKVLQILADGRASLAIANTTVGVVSPVPLTVGATVHLAVRHTPEGIRLSLLDPTHLAGAKGAVPLVVDASSRPALEAAFPVTTAFHAPVGAAGAGAGAADAGRSAAQSAQVATTTSAMPNVSSPPLSPAVTTAAALAQAVRGAAARQSGLAPLFADVAMAVNSPALPEAVKAAAAQVLALRVPVEDGLTAPALRQAVQSSGLFLEANLAAQGAAAAPSNDLKAALLSLRQVLKALVAAEAGVVAPRELALPSPPASPPPAMSSAYTAAAPVPPANIPPPYRGAPTVAQPEAMAQIGDDTPADHVARVLMRDAEGSLSRQTLLQAASLPDQSHHSEAANSSRWHFEIPFATPQGTTLAQFEISRDGHAAPAERHQTIWRARFSIDVEPLGAVHAQVALIGERAAVTLWAERPEAVARMREGASDLKAALADADFEPDILVRDGAPPRPREATAPTGHFLDRAT